MGNYKMMMIYDIVYAIHEDRLAKGTSLPLLQQSQDKYSQVPFKTTQLPWCGGYQLIHSILSAPLNPFFLEFRPLRCQLFCKRPSFSNREHYKKG